LIKIDNLSFKYNNSEDYALSGISLTINEGEFICITGPSGGGKSTFALALCGFIPHIIEGKFTGQVYLQNLSTGDLTLADISQFIGLVQQDPENQLVTSTPFEEIAFGPENLCLTTEEIYKRINKSLSILDLKSLAFRSIDAMSGGEKQRVAIAAILAMHPKVLVFDEPTSFLDRKNSRKFLNVIGELNQKDNITIIIIDHQPIQFKKYITRLIALEHGKLVIDSDHKEINYEKYSIPKTELKCIQKIKPKLPLDTFLTIQNLNINRNNRLVIDKVSLTLKLGLVYGIKGPNGAGKTTLLEAILNLIPGGQNIVYRDQIVSDIPTHILASNFGLVFQNPNNQIFENTIEKEILFAPKNFNLNLKKANERALDLFSETKLEQYIGRPPFSLSYGEKRRLNISSVDIYEPMLLLLDEPFIGQDSGSISYLLNMIERRKIEGKTTLIISHRNELLDLADYFFFLDQGKLLFQGDSKEITKFLRDYEKEDSYE
jgi:energy-coupling factor transport system ATP-binding protein